MPIFRKIIVLLTICFIGIPGFYVYESIAAIGLYMEASGYTKIEISFLYNCFYFPNIIVSLFTGIIIDKLGENPTSIVFSIFMLIGQGLISFFKNIVAMSIGRCLLGIGASAIFICQLKMFSTNFPNHKSTVFAIHMIFNRGCSLLSYLTLPLIANIRPIDNDWRVALYLCTLICVICLVVNILYVILDKNKNLVDSNTPIMEIKSGLIFCLRHPAVWILILIAFFFYGCFMSYNALSPIIIYEMYGFNKETASQIVSFLFLGSMIFTPIIGFLCDRYGHRNIHMGVALLLSIIVFSSMVLTQTINIVFLTIILGIGYGVTPNLIYTLAVMSVKNEYIGITIGLLEVAIAWAVLLFSFGFSYLVQINRIPLALSMSALLLTVCFILNMILGLYSKFKMGNLYGKPLFAQIKTFDEKSDIIFESKPLLHKDYF